MTAQEIQGLLTRRIESALREVRTDGELTVTHGTSKSLRLRYRKGAREAIFWVRVSQERGGFK